MTPPGRPHRLLPLFAVSAVTVLLLDLAGFGPIMAVRRTVLSIGQPIGAVLAFVASPLAGTWNGAVHYDDLAEENRELRRRVAELEGDIASRPDIEADLRALTEATDIDYLADIERVTARVVADRQTDLERIVEIDKGSDVGITRGMPVVTGRGLVGVVELVTGDRSSVRLITDVDVAVGVRSEHGLGLTVGERDGELALQTTPELVEAIRLGAVLDGERFVTSGVDRSTFPAGIPVGALVVAPRPVRGGQDLAAGSTETDSAAGNSYGTGSFNTGSYESATIEVSLDLFAEIDRLGYLTVLLTDPPA